MYLELYSTIFYVLFCTLMVCYVIIRCRYFGYRSLMALRERRS